MGQTTSVPAEPVRPSHPYYPEGVKIAGYAANNQTVPFLLSTFAGGCTVILAFAYTLLRRQNPSLSNGELATALWFVICGFIHVFFEGYYIANFGHMGGMQDVFGQLWKEYALSDSRYLAQNGFVLCVEFITVAVWGPLSFVVAALIAGDHPLRYPLQMAVSIGHLYSDTLYYLTAAADKYLLNIEHSRPEPVYFWGYYFGLNFIWIIVPICLIYSSVTASARAFTALNASESALRRFRASGKRTVDASTKKKA